MVKVKKKHLSQKITKSNPMQGFKTANYKCKFGFPARNLYFSKYTYKY